MGAHKNATEIHVPYNWTYADATARAAATGFVPGDVGKLARQTDDNSLWMLTDDSPATWVAVGAASNSFATIAVSGQSNVVADSSTDTLTLVAGTNVTITTNAGSDSVTINASSGGGSAPDYIKIADHKSSGTAGGSFTSGSWQTRVLNTEVADAGGHASLSSNQITLAAGTYDFRVICPAYYVDTHQAKLYNVTDAADVELGTNTSCGRDTNGAVTASVVSGRFTIASSKAFEVQHRCTTSQASVGLGLACSFGTEVYTVAEFWKVA